MSSLENELALLQEKDWSEKEIEMIKSLTENIKYYRKLIPNTLKKDICEALNMCNELLFYNEPNKINLANSWLNPFNENVYKKYLKCRFRDFEDLDNTSIFFAKNSIF
jgi:beta-glucosidase/6-phospho-beta-glucosidase/beta-galactosidase